MSERVSHVDFVEYDSGSIIRIIKSPTNVRFNDGTQMWEVSHMENRVNVTTHIPPWRIVQIRQRRA